MHSPQKHLEEPLLGIYNFNSVSALNLLYINYIQIVERICGITYLFIGFNSADRYWFNRLSVPYTYLDGITTWNICYRQTDTISDRKTHAPIEIEAHRNVEVTIWVARKGFRYIMPSEAHFAKGIGFTSCKES